MLSLVNSMEHHVLQGSDVGMAVDIQSDGDHPWMAPMLRRVWTRPYPRALRGSSIRVEM
jgi:hypothetical protein